jgi:pyrimidine-nucleoside phosphorylase
MLPAELIKKKRNGGQLSSEEITDFISQFTEGKIPEYQMSALLMAIFFKGMSSKETLSLTKAMLHSGTVIDFSDLPFPKVDKHSTGGVGDKTSLILGPIVAACGVAVPMISGRGLGHTGGTLDKLESIPGFNTQLSLDQFRKMISKNKISFIGQTKDICPADKKIYALRDVTATVESLPLICASIMSKKLAEGIDALVLDVKYGSGAFMKDRADAETLARALSAIAKGYGKKVSAFITNMNQPLGRFAGNALEIGECLDILNNKRRPEFEDTRELSIILAAKMLHITGVTKNFSSAKALATKTLESGKALEKFEELCKIQGGDITKIPKAKHNFEIKSLKSGYIKSMDTEKIGIAGIQIKAGRAIATDIIEPTAGIEFHCKVGSKLKKGDLLFTVHGASVELLKSVESDLRETLSFSSKPVKKEKLVWKEL